MGTISVHLPVKFKQLSKQNNSVTELDWLGPFLLNLYDKRASIGIVVSNQLISLTGWMDVSKALLRGQGRYASLLLRIQFGIVEVANLCRPVAHCSQVQM